MIEQINNKIEAINELLAWLQKNKPELYEQRFVLLVQERCRLNTIKKSMKENPAIAAYGESQKGKSYLMGNLLQRNGNPFMITVPTGEQIDFVRSINPIGDGAEATGVVTRFTAFTGKNSGRYEAKYPVLMKLLTVADMATILCDSYYNDLFDAGEFGDEEMAERGKQIYDEYKNNPVQDQPVLKEDDIIGIKNYIEAELPSRASSLNRNKGIFDKVAFVIHRVPEQKISDVLKFLWHDNDVFTQLFNRLVAAMGRLGYAEEVYLPIEAVLHGGSNEKTIMSVDCLNRLDQANFSETTDVYLKNSTGFAKVSGFNKAELCAICAETAYKVEEDFLNTTAEYCLDMLPEDTKSKMTTVKVSKDVLEHTDLLDFPGARNRENIRQANLNDYDEKEGVSNKVKVLLRGKVAYLFNSYCASRAINILMFCHDQIDYHVTTMPYVLEKWVHQYVGDTPDERQEKTISKLQGISPLFIIATKFNIDMAVKGAAGSELNSTSALTGRWTKRFQKILYKDCLQANSVEWFNNWVRKNETFKNTYLLRDFKYSGDTGDGNKLYSGFKEGIPDTKEEKLLLSQEFYKDLRDTFTSCEIVRKFFADPEKSWDLAATKNNDGALYIIEQLRIVAKGMGDIRNKQFEDEVRESMKRVFKLMENDYEPEDDGKNLLKDIKTAKGIMREMDLSCQMDMYFFGHMIQTLQIPPTLTYNLIKDFVDNGDTGNPDEKVYEIVSKRCKYFEGCNTIAEKMNRYMEEYGFDSIEDAEEDMRNRGLDKDILFAMKKVRLSNSAMATRRVYNKWLEHLQGSNLFNRLLKDGRHHDVAALSALTTRLVENAEKLNLSDHLADLVSKYLDIIAIHTTNIGMVSDIVTHAINSFVCDWGYSLLSDDQLKTAKEAAEQQGITIGDYIGKGIEPLPKEDDVSRLFTEMMRENKGVTRTFEQNYNEWIEFMFVAFLGNAKHVIKNPVANHELGLILQKVK